LFCIVDREKTAKKADLFKASSKIASLPCFLKETPTLLKAARDAARRVVHASKFCGSITPKTAPVDKRGE
jgi:hypothetical protein